MSKFNVGDRVKCYFTFEFKKIEEIGVIQSIDGEGLLEVSFKADSCRPPIHYHLWTLHPKQCRKIVKKEPNADATNVKDLHIKRTVDDAPLSGQSSVKISNLEDRMTALEEAFNNLCLQRLRER